MLLLCGFADDCRAQATPPAAYPSTRVVNSIRTWEATAPIQTVTDLQGRAVTDVKQTTVYTDAMGRLLQTVGKQMSPGKNDVVAAYTYDPATGKETIRYLPFSGGPAQTPDAPNDGNIKMNAFGAQVAFYNTQMQAAGQTGEYNVGAASLNWAYSNIQYENSPLNRVTGTYSPGSSWVGSSRGAKVQVLVNTAADNVQIWNIAVSAVAGAPSISGVYGAGQLYKYIMTDEGGKQTIQYKDKDGHILLKKVQSTAVADPGTGSDHPGWLCTYYVYDDLGLLRFIIPPLLVDAIYSSGTWASITTAQLTELCYYFDYDILGHLIVRHNPGTPLYGNGEVWMVYDERNRLVMEQDANMRGQQKWFYIVYDGLDRPVQTGLLTDPGTVWPSPTSDRTPLTTKLNAAGASIAYPTLSSYTCEVLTVTHYDDYTGMGASTTGALTSTLDVSVNGAANTSFATTYNVSSSNYAQPIIKSAMTRGLVTWSSTEVIGPGYAANSKYLYSVSFFDNKGREDQSLHTNISGGEDLLTTQFNWIGLALTIVQTENIVSGGSVVQTQSEVAKRTYDHAGRLLTITRQLTTTAPGTSTVSTPPTVTLTNTYNELGQLATKGLGGSETLKYDYTIRNWLAGINKSYLSPGYTPPVGGGSFFGMELAYDKTASVTGNNYGAAQVNGNIAGQSWKSRGDLVDRQYTYSYDNVNRMAAASFADNSNGGVWGSSYLNFGVSGLTYDDNGNLLSLNRMGFKLGGSTAIDNLTYTYTPGTNRLQSVVDAVSDPATKLGDFRASQAYQASLGGPKTVPNAASYIDYAYDCNGNMITDLNRDMGAYPISSATPSTAPVSPAITYNYLNKPAQITVGNEGTVQYIYNAGGDRLAKIVNETNATVVYNGTSYNSAVTSTTNYIEGMVYKSVSYVNTTLSTSPLQLSNVLQFAGYEEGRIRFIPAAGSVAASYVFDYFIKDNLNNVRMTLTTESQFDNYPAATMEGGVAGITNNTSLIYNEAPYYTFNQNDIVSTVTVGSTPTPIPWFANAAHSIYNNYNGSASNQAPLNNNANLPDGTNATATSQYVYRLNPALNPGDITGMGITLKVMAGDKIAIYGKSAWHNPSTGTPTNNQTLAISALLTAFAAPGSSLAGFTHGGATPALLNGNAATTSGLNGILPYSNTLNNGVSQPVKAGINWILFDDQFRPVQAGSGYDPVNTDPDDVKTHALAGLPNLTMPENGYLYVYVSNESNMDVVFDNLQVQNIRGPILDETHLYPDGLTIAAISDMAWNKQVNNFHYQYQELQHREFSDGSGLEQYDFGARFYDPQLGVWHNQDPSSQYASPYAAMGNRWPNGMDPNGQWFGIDDLIASVVGGLLNLGENLFSGNVHSFAQGLEDFGIGAAAGEVTLYAGPVAGAVILGSGNELVQGGNLTDIVGAGIESGALSLFSTVVSSAVTEALNTSAGNKILSWAEKGAIRAVVSELQTDLLTGKIGKLDIDQVLKTAAGGAVLGVAQGAVGSIPGIKTTHVGDLLYNAFISIGKSAVTNWANGDALFSKVNVAVGPITIALGQGASLTTELTANWQLLANLGNWGASAIWHVSEVNGFTEGGVFYTEGGVLAGFENWLNRLHVGHLGQGVLGNALEGAVNGGDGILTSSPSQEGSWGQVWGRIYTWWKL